MATPVQVSPEEYLTTIGSECPPEYVRGKVVERSFPDYLHAATQAELAYQFCSLRKEQRLYAALSLHLRLAPDLFRIADVAVFANDPPTELIPSSPPLIVVEVIAPDDRFDEVWSKLEEYSEWGVAHIWIVGPRRQRCWVFSGGSLLAADSFLLPEHGVAITKAMLFPALS